MKFNTPVRSGLVTVMGFVAVCAGSFGVGAGPAWARGPFDLPGSSGAAVVRAGASGEGASGAEARAAWKENDEKVDVLAGRVVRLGKKELAALKGCVVGGKLSAEEVKLIEGAEGTGMREYFRVIVEGARGEEGQKPGKELRKESVREAVIARDENGRWYVRATGLAKGKGAAKEESAEVYALDERKFASLAAAWPKFQGDIAAIARGELHMGVEIGKVVPLERPVAGWWRMDPWMLGERFLAGQKTALDGATRVLSEETFEVRLPRNMGKERVPGVLVWVDAGDVGSVHRCLWEGADAQGLIVVCAKRTGNAVHIANRYQLAFDALQTVQERWVCDPQRVYVSGISGGARICTHLWACFPDVFAGAVGVVGFESYEMIPAGGGKMYRAGFSKPPAKMWKLLSEHRMGVMTGPSDFSYGQIMKIAKVYSREKIEARVFEYADMGHELPTAGRFAEVLKWVEEGREGEKEEKGEKGEKGERK